MGWYPAKVIAALNVVEQLGWSAVGCITGGLALSAVSDGHVSLILGVVVIAALGLAFSFVGLRAVLKYDQWAWLVFFVIFMIMYGEAAPLADLATPSAVTGSTLSGTVLTLLAIVYGSSASWCSICSDYYVQYPVETSKTKVFVLTTLGITIPTCIGMCMGACVGEWPPSPKWSIQIARADRLLRLNDGLQHRLVRRLSGLGPRLPRPDDPLPPRLRQIHPRPPGPVRVSVTPTPPPPPLLVNIYRALADRNSQQSA